MFAELTENECIIERHMHHIHCEAKKTAPCYFCHNFVKSFLFE